MKTKTAFGLMFLIGILSFNSFASQEVLGGRVSCQLQKDSKKREKIAIECGITNEEGQCTYYRNVYASEDSCNSGECNWKGHLDEGRILADSSEIRNKMPFESFKNVSKSFGLNYRVRLLDKFEDTPSECKAGLAVAAVEDTVTYPFRSIRERLRTRSDDRRIAQMITQKKYDMYLSMIDFMTNPEQTGNEIELSWEDCEAMSNLKRYNYFVAKAEQSKK
jgi:hypothetical protein